MCVCVWESTASGRRTKGKGKNFKEGMYFYEADVTL